MNANAENIGFDSRSSPVGGIRLMVVHEPSPALVRDCATRLSPAERADFSRMADPRAADVRAVLRAEANRLRESGAMLSVAHSAAFGVLAYAGAKCGSLGVDCEPWAGEVPDADLVRTITSAEEFSAWSALPAASRRPAFVRLWTLKEAVIKARGTGLAGGMAPVRVRPDFSALDEPGWESAFAEIDGRYAVAVVWRGACSPSF